MNTEHATAPLFAALAKAQAEIENASKNSSNPHFKSKYADLAEVLTTIRETMSKHGLSLIQSPSFDGSMASVTTILAHAEGGYIVATASCVPAKTDAQGIGAATTYLRRYSAAAMAGIAQEDDDGQAAAHNRKPASPVVHGNPTTGVFDSLSADDKLKAKAIAETIVEYRDAGDLAGAAEYLERLGLDVNLKVAMWSLLDSKIRTALTKIMKGE